MRRTRHAGTTGFSSSTRWPRSGHTSSGPRRSLRGRCRRSRSTIATRRWGALLTRARHDGGDVHYRVRGPGLPRVHRTQPGLRAARGGAHGPNERHALPGPGLAPCAAPCALCDVSLVRRTHSSSCRRRRRANKQEPAARRPEARLWCPCEVRKRPGRPSGIGGHSAEASGGPGAAPTHCRAQREGGRAPCNIAARPWSQRSCAWAAPR